MDRKLEEFLTIRLEGFALHILDNKTCFRLLRRGRLPAKCVTKTKHLHLLMLLIYIIINMRGTKKKKTTLCLTVS